MRRIAPGALLLLLAGAPLFAQQAPDQAPAAVDPAEIQKKTDDLRDAIAGPSTDDDRLHDQAARLTRSIQSETPFLRPAPRVMDREHVDGHVGTIDGMLAEAQKRWDHYKVAAAEVPDAKLDAAVAYAKDLRAQKRIVLDAAMAENQMGEFEYPKEKLDGGIVKLNSRLTLMATRIGESFCYAALVHQAAHAKARAEGRLAPGNTLDNEIEAYRVQYFWLKAIDPRAERMIVLHSTLKLHLILHPEDKVSRLSVAYLEHLLQLWDTRGEDDALRELVKRLGYGEKGVDPSATPMRV